jgi:ParB-like chromosome segregation protein Spo0J
MLIRDRIKDLRRVRASELLPNPHNWRTHPKAQQEALRAILAEVGYADALLARETAGGELMLIDGHLRAETTPETLVPVLVLDVDEAEAAKLLATLDPLAAMAEADTAKLSGLLQDVKTGSQALQEMLAQLAASAATATVPGTEPSRQPNLATRYAIIVTCETEEQQRELLEQFDAQGLECRALVM